MMNPNLHSKTKPAPSLTDPQACLDFFKTQALHHLHYWSQHPALQSLDITTLDRRRDSILSVINAGLKFQEAWPLVRALIETFTHFMERRGHWQAWNDLLQRAIVMANRVGDADGAITLSTLLARTYSRQSRPKETIYHYRRVIRLARQTGNRYEQARACSNLGYLYTDKLGQWWRAEILCCHALAIFEELDSDHGRAHTENHLGFLYNRLHAWSKAEIHLKRACDIWQKMEDAHGLIHGFQNLGMLYVDMDRPLEALVFLEKAVHQVKLTGEEAELGNIWNNMAIAHRQNGNLQQAKTFAIQAEGIFRKVSNSLGLAQIWDNLGEIYFNQKRWSEAIYYLNASLETYHKLNNWDGEIKVLFSLVQCTFAEDDSLQTTVHLNKLEQLIMQHTQGAQQNLLIQRLSEYHQHLDMASVKMSQPLH